MKNKCLSSLDLVRGQGSYKLAAFLVTFFAEDKSDSPSGETRSSQQMVLKKAITRPCGAKPRYSNLVFSQNLN